mgnify:CR=1 FL=1
MAKVIFPDICMSAGFKIIYLAGKEKEDEHEDHEIGSIHESAWPMTFPLAVLAIPSVLIGFLGVPWNSIFANLLDPVEAIEAAEKFSWGEFLPLATASVAISSAGILLAVLTYYLKRFDLGVSLSKKYPQINSFLQNKWYLDDINEEPDLVIYNPSSRVRGRIEELDIENTRHALNITSFGAFLVAQQSVKRMKKKGSGSIFFTGASASTKGFPNSSVFAMGKFALRGLAQSLARELHPQNIHIGHFIIDGSIVSENRPYEKDDDKLCPDEIAKRYLEFYKQKRSVWSWELEIRPWLEKF